MMDLTMNRPRGKEGTAKRPFSVEFPQVHDSNLPQDHEWCLVRTRTGERRIRFHDYHEIYEVPGLYEHIFYERLQCRSPSLVAALLQHEVSRAGMSMAQLSVLDVGAGNGIMGEVLAAAGVKTVVGVDLLEEARAACERDRPGLYRAYHAVDMTQLSPEMSRDLASRHFNCLTLIAALGFGDIPPEVFRVAYNLVRNEGWIAFNIKDSFLHQREPTGFSRLIWRMIETERFTPLIEARYVHRLSITGEPLYYTAFVGRKLADLPEEGHA